MNSITWALVGLLAAWGLAFANLGIAYLVTSSKLLEEPRAALESELLALEHTLVAALVRCPACVAFWVGLGEALVLWSAYKPNLSVWEGLAGTILLGFYSCGTTLFLGLVSGLVCLGRPGTR